MHIFQVHIGDTLARKSIYSALNPGHEGKIRQKTLDFYRNRYSYKLKNGWSIIFIIAIPKEEQEPIAISACAVGRKTKRFKHSLTIVNPNYRRIGVGKTVLRAKLDVLKSWFPDVKYKSFVNMDNAPSIALCNSSNLYISGEGTRERQDKDPTDFYIFEEI